MGKTPLYTNSLFSPRRRKTRAVYVGNVAIGGKNPVVVQSMTTTPTMDTMATVDQVEKLQNVGCEIVRITTPTINDAKNLANIKKEMERRKLYVPISADVHFLPQVAMEACNWVEKVRVNPGNFADRKKFEVKEYSDSEYDRELERLYQAFSPIVRKAQERKIAIRIGTNHGSLSDRIMNRYGDTPLGMVESALEFVRIAQSENYHDLVISMKSSNPTVMIQAYRLLVSKMLEFGMDYPLHLGVTEAGNGQDGRVKSAIGIASLLSDGLGDTIRVSLTEDPEFEIPVARKIVEHYALTEFEELKTVSEKDPSPVWNVYEYQRRRSECLNVGPYSIGGSEIPRVYTHVSHSQLQTFVQNRSEVEPQPDGFSFNFESPTVLPVFSQDVGLLMRISEWKPLSDQAAKQESYRQLSIRPNQTWTEPRFLEKLETLVNDRMIWLRCERESDIEPAIKMVKALSSKTKIGLEIAGRRLIQLGRKVAIATANAETNPPILLHWKASENDGDEDVIVQAANEIGSLLCDGIGDCIEIETANVKLAHELSFTILQSTRLRMSRADYIACPSCGRTLFDLQTTTARIKSQTDHLVGVKIAIMGCIVNGPGEMADADFGYVGSGPGHINLYVGKECVERSIPQEDADRKLIELIKQHGRWIEPTAE